MSVPPPAATTVAAPEAFSVELETTKGLIIIDVTRAWSPRGADRFYELATNGFLSELAFFRVVPGFVAQVGIHGDPAVNKIWKKALFKDDPVVQKNDVGTVTFATSGKNARTTQFFINLRNNARLDAMGFSPFGRVRDLEVANLLHSEYGDGPPAGRGPQQGRIHREGNAYLNASFPDLDWLIEARIHS